MTTTINEATGLVESKTPEFDEAAMRAIIPDAGRPKADFIAQRRQIHFRERDGRIAVEGPWFDGVVEPHALGQILSGLAPGMRRYAEEMIGYGRVDRVVEDAEYLLHEAKTIRGERPGRDEYLVRCHGTPDDPGPVRAFLSPSYRVIDDESVVLPAMEALASRKDEFRFLGGMRDSRRTVVSAVSNEPVFRDGPRSFHWGFRVLNSEVGSGVAGLALFVADRFCSNGMIMGMRAVGGVHVRHRGSLFRDSPGRVQYTGRGRRFLREFREDVAATVDRFLSEPPERLADRLKALSGARIGELAGDMGFHDVGRVFNLTKSETEALPRYFRGGADPTALEAVSALTAMARSRSLDRRLELERRAGELLENPKRLLALAN